MGSNIVGDHGRRSWFRPNCQVHLPKQVVSHTRKNLLLAISSPIPGDGIPWTSNSRQETQIVRVPICACGCCVLDGALCHQSIYSISAHSARKRRSWLG